MTYADVGSPAHPRAKVVWIPLLPRRVVVCTLHLTYDVTVHMSHITAAVWQMREGPRSLHRPVGLVLNRVMVVVLCTYYVQCIQCIVCTVYNEKFLEARESRYYEEWYICTATFITRSSVHDRQRSSPSFNGFKIQLSFRWCFICLQPTELIK